MATITFDSYNFIDRLTQVGMAEDQARAIADGLKDLSLENVVTNKDLRVSIAELKADLLKWLVPILIGQAALIATLVEIL